jgi:hypothetical protein
MRKLLLIAFCTILCGCSELYNLPEQTKGQTDSSTEIPEGDTSRTYLKRPITYSTNFTGMTVTNPGYAYDGDLSTYANITRESTTFYGSGDFILDLGMSYYATSIYYKILSSAYSSYPSPTLALYGSSDGSSWTLISNITISGTAAEYTPTINSRYRYYKFTFAGMTVVRVFELYINALVSEENSNIRMAINNKGIVLSCEDTLISPVRFYNGSSVKSLYLVPPNDAAASGFRKQFDPASAFVIGILGSGSDGILAAAIWSYFMSTTLKLLSWNFTATHSYARFGDSSDNYLFQIEWGRQTVSAGASLAITFTNTFTNIPSVTADSNAAFADSTKARGAYDSLTTSGMNVALIGGDNSTLSAGTVTWIAMGA